MGKVCTVLTVVRNQPQYTLMLVDLAPSSRFSRSPHLKSRDRSNSISTSQNSVMY